MGNVQLRGAMVLAVDQVESVISPSRICMVGQPFPPRFDVEAASTSLDPFQAEFR
jgi:hypothetical protein